MPDKFRISKLPTSASFNNQALVEVSDLVQGVYSSVKKTITELGEKLNNNLEYSAALSTTDKTVIGAINEVNGKGIADLSDTDITTPTANQVLAYDGNNWENVGLNSLMPTTITVVRGSTMSNIFPLPNVSRRGNVCIVNFAIQIPAGTYSNTDTLWDISPKPITNTRCMLAFSANSNNFTNVNLLTDGTIKFNGSQTVASDSWLIGQAVYLTDG